MARETLYEKGRDFVHAFTEGAEATELDSFVTSNTHYLSKLH